MNDKLNVIPVNNLVVISIKSFQLW